MVAETGLRGRLARVRSSEPGLRGWPRRAVVLLWRLTVATTNICLRWRVTGLAAEAGFFALLSLPPLVLGLVGSVGFIGNVMGADVVADLREQLQQLTLTFLTADSVDTVILPTFDRVVGTGRADIISIGFLLSLWSGSRALNVYVDTISIMYGLGGHRGIIRTRALSFSLYVATMLAGVVVIPLVLIGPGILGDLFASLDLDLLSSLVSSGLLYWPVVIVVTVAGISLLYHIATPVRSPWRRDVPGALLALAIWVLASFILRWVLGHSVGGASIYGPLATPIVVLIWLYFLAIAVLIGAALNAAIDERYPILARVAARAEHAAREAEASEKAARKRAAAEKRAAQAAAEDERRAEAGRLAAEQAAAERAERKRAAAEARRLAAETKRAAAESKRVAAEARRAAARSPGLSAAPPDAGRPDPVRPVPLQPPPRSGAGVDGDEHRDPPVPGAEPAPLQHPPGPQ